MRWIFQAAMHLEGLFHLEWQDDAGHSDHFYALLGSRERHSDLVYLLSHRNETPLQLQGFTGPLHTDDAHAKYVCRKLYNTFCACLRLLMKRQAPSLWGGRCCVVTMELLTPDLSIGHEL